MPRGETDGGDVYFFRPRPEAYDMHGLVSHDNRRREFEFFGLKPCDPYKLAQVNEDDPVFADQYKTITHWENASGTSCYVVFYRWYDGRRVHVDHGDCHWLKDLWLAGLLK